MHVRLSVLNSLVVRLPTRDLPTVGEGAFSVFITGIAIACNNSTIIHLMLTKEALEKKHLKRHMEFMSVGKI